MPPDIPSRDTIAEQFLAQLPYPPYPMQEEALLAWFTSEQGVMLCAPTGTGKTLIAQAALFEALHTGKTAYYTTPLIALTEQKFQEMQDCAERWGFTADQVGLVTGNRRVNPQAPILVVVAEILLNRLLHPAAFSFDNVATVVMDEFHSFADPERGIVWELTLSMLPPQVRLMLLSATVGNAREFLAWLDRCHGRKLQLVESSDRKVPLTYVWTPDLLLSELMVEMAKGDPAGRKTPALVFCFNRDECWSVAEMLKGLPLLDEEQKKRVNAEVDTIGWAHGMGPKLKQMLRRGVGVHHAGLLPKYRRVIGELFEQKMLAVVVCTETLAAGINLPARSVILSTLVKGPFGKQKLIDASTAHQIFGRAGRPQYDTQGFVYALAHEDDVRILRWKEKYDQIPEDTRDPVLLKAKKDLKRKKPTRRENQMYWSEGDFRRLQAALPGKLYSKGPLPWRLLAYLLHVSPEVGRIQRVVHKRLLDEGRIRAGERVLRDMLMTLQAGGFVTLDPPPPLSPMPAAAAEAEPPASPRTINPDLGDWYPMFAYPTPLLERLLVFRSIHPLYGAYLIDMLGVADQNELIQALESVLEIPRPLLRHVRVPLPDQLPPGPLATQRLDPELVRRGLIAAPVREQGGDEEEDEEDDRPPWERFPTLADKLRLYFDALYPQVGDVITQSVWAAGELLAFAGDFNKFVQARDLLRQEGIIFRHLLRLILLCGEFRQVCPPDIARDRWEAELRNIADRITESCRAVDPNSTDQAVEQAQAVPVDEGEILVP